MKKISHSAPANAIGNSIDIHAFEALVLCNPPLPPILKYCENTPLTSPSLLDHYSSPRNVGSMDKNSSAVGTGLVGAPACGDVMKLQIQVDPTTNTISDVKFKTFGCGSAIASSSYLTELVRGMTLEDAGKVRNTEIAKELCLPPVKRA